MRISKSILTVLLVLIPGTLDVFARPWRGLTPAQSSKLDATRFDETCRTAIMRCSFTVEDADVLIIFSGGNIGDGRCPKLQEATVLAISITFKQPRRLEDFKLKNQKAVVFDPSSPPGHGYKAYYYQDEGFIISTFKGRVLKVVYIAGKKDIHYCPEYYENPKGFVAVGLVY